jgi:hypothetical protein
VHDVESDEQRDAETRLLHGQALHVAYVRRPDQVEQIPDRAGLNRIGRIADDDRTGHRKACGGHGELPELFRQGHGAHQRIDTVHLIPLRRSGVD